MSLLAFEDVTKRYRYGARSAPIFDGVSLEVERGDFVAIWGERRSGKSTLLRLAAGIERPDAGVVRFMGRDLAAMSGSERADVLLREIGFVSTPMDFGATRTARSATVIDQVSLPLMFDGHSRVGAAVAARRMLADCGVADCADAMPKDLKADELTRVALARALVRGPRLLLVDEPAVTTSPAARESLKDLIGRVGRQPPLAVVVASEEVTMLAGASRVLSVGDGRVLSSDRPGVVVRFPGAVS